MVSMLSNQMLNIISSNVRGLNNFRKWRMLLNGFMQINCQSLLIQDTHLVLESESIFQSEWGNRNMVFFHVW